MFWTQLLSLDQITIKCHPNHCFCIAFGGKYDLLRSVKVRGDMQEVILMVWCWSTSIRIYHSCNDLKHLAINLLVVIGKFRLKWFCILCKQCGFFFFSLSPHYTDWFCMMFFRGCIYSANSRHKESCHLRSLLSFRVSHCQLSSPFMQFGGKLCFRFLLRLVLISPAARRCWNSLIWKCVASISGCGRLNRVVDFLARREMHVCLINLIW